MRKIIFILFILSLNLYATEHTIQKEKLIKSRKSDNQGTSIGNKSIISEKHHNDSFKQKTIATCNYRTDVTIDVQVDYWYDEASWNIWIGGQGYYYASNQTFSYAYESQSRTLDLPEGDHSVDCWDTEEDGGISGNTTGATTNVSWNANDYTDFGEFWFYVGSTGDPDLVVNSIVINESVNPTDNTVYTPGWDPCSVTVTIENIGNANASGFDIALLYHDAETGWEELLDTEYVSSLNAGSTDNIVFDYYDFDEDFYMYHNGTDPAKVKLYARVDYWNSIPEDDEYNNDSSETGWIYFIEHATYDNYGCCAGVSFITDLSDIAGVFGEARTGPPPYFHNAIDIEATNGSNCYSISSGSIEYVYDASNSFIRMRSNENNSRHFNYVHVNNPQYNYSPPYPYRNSGIYICDVNSEAHIHFVDRTETSGSYKNPLRSDGIMRSSESSIPQVSTIRLYENSSTPVNWNQQPLFWTGNTNIIDVQIFDDFEIAVDAADNLGWFHGGSAGFSKGIYSIGYRLKNSQNQILLDELDRIVFNSLPSVFDYVYAGGSDTYNYYYIATNSNSSNTGSLDISNYPNGNYTLEVIAKDIDGNLDIETLEFEITGSITEVIETENIPFVNYLSHNHPNPFNPTTTISYSLAENSYDPKIEIYNVKGQKVKNLQLENIIGENSIVWNGKDANDKSVSSGVYFYSLINEGKTVQSRKMLMLK